MNETPSFTQENRIRDLLCFFFSTFERLALLSPLFFRLYDAWLGRLFENEVRLADITKNDSILHVGCGPLPFLSCLVVERAHAHVHAIDRDQGAVEKAREFIRKRGLSDYVTIAKAEAVSLPVHEYSVIFVAINVTPIDGILRHLAADARPRARIICRSCGTNLQRMLQGEEFTPFFIIRTTTQGIVHSLLLEKK